MMKRKTCYLINHRGITQLPKPQNTKDMNLSVIIFEQ